jgi:hypothetical protein
MRNKTEHCCWKTQLLDSRRQGFTAERALNPFNAARPASAADPRTRALRLLPESEEAEERQLLPTLRVLQSSEMLP